MATSKRRNLHLKVNTSSAHAIPQGNKPPGEETAKTLMPMLCLCPVLSHDRFPLRILLSQ